jgi:hypothetical protein
LHLERSDSLKAILKQAIEKTFENNLKMLTIYMLKVMVVLGEPIES